MLFFRKRETSGQPKPRDVGIRWWRFRGWSRPPKTEPTPFEPSSSSECVFQAPFCPLLGHGSPSRWCCCSRSHSCTWPPDRTRGPNSDSPSTNLPIVPTTSFFLSFTSSNQKNHNTILAGHGQPPPPPPPPSSSYACLPRRFFTRKNRTQSTVNGGGSQEKKKYKQKRKMRLFTSKSGPAGRNSLAIGHTRHWDTFALVFRTGTHRFAPFFALFKLGFDFSSGSH